MAKEARRPRPEEDPLGTLASRCADALQSLYSLCHSHPEPAEGSERYKNSVRCILRMLAVLIAADRIPPDRSAFDPIRRAAEAIVDGSDGAGYGDALAAIRETAGLAIFEPADADDGEAFRLAAQHLLRPRPDAPIERLYFQTMPLSWLGGVYQRLLSFRPDETGEHLVSSQSYRKGRGVFFTPPALVSYIVESALTLILESRAQLSTSRTKDLPPIRILDPAMGGGDFLTAVVDHLLPAQGGEGRGGALPALLLGERAGVRATPAECVYGIDVDPLAVEIARFSVWAACGFPDGIAEILNSHLICANALALSGDEDDENPPALSRETSILWSGVSKRGLLSTGFDAVIGNPPYIAAKNGLAARATGQSDSYLLFLSQIMRSNLVKPGGLLSMVLPDPMLVRENAAEIRCKLAKGWSIVSILHISEAFPDALVANVIPICRNSPPSSPTFCATRIDKAADRHAFLQRPRQTAQDLGEPVRLESVTAQERCEFLYLLEQGGFGEVISRIHGESASISTYQEPFAPLRKLNIKAIYRGEEVGKSAINRETGDQPVLLGGQSIQPYEIVWEGRKAGESWVRKPLERYHSTKILVQKSSAHLIAAPDRVSKRHPGYVFPQSVYAVELADHGMDPWYLLCLLNSRVLNEYIWRTVTGYKLLQPQLELEDIRALPIRRINFTTQISHRQAEVAQGISIFETESLRSGDFPHLKNFAAQCFSASPERSDVVHDLLAHLGRELTELIRSNRKSPEAEKTRRMEITREAIETLVWALYCSQPTQMALPW